MRDLSSNEYNNCEDFCLKNDSSNFLAQYTEVLDKSLTFPKVSRNNNQMRIQIRAN